MTCLSKMKTLPARSFHRCPLALASFSLLLGAGALQAQNQTINGDLNVAGSLDVSGPVFNLGTWTDNPAKLGLNLTYSEDPQHSATLAFITARPIIQWQWLRAASATNAASVPQMTLGSSNALTLYDVALPTPHAAIVLDPMFGSTFNGDVTLGGVNNKMPNQQLDDDASVLTLGLADERYVLRGTGNNLSLGYGASAPGASSTALGAYSRAQGDYSTALSFGAQATKPYAVALGNNSAATGVQATALGANSAATGDLATTLGYGSVASGPYANAIGYGSRATGVVANALGAYSKAYGDYSVTLGDNSTADAAHAAALGTYSYAHGDYSVAQAFCSAATGNLSSALGAYSIASNTATVALGTYSTASGYSAISMGGGSVASGAYSASIGGNTVADGFFQTVVGIYNLTGGSPNNWVPTEDLFTVGNGWDNNHRSNAFSVKKNGDATVSGTLTVPTKIVASNVTVSGALLIQPQGDLPMGDFTVQPSPAP